MSPTNVAQIRDDASQFDSLNLRVCPIIFVPGVMGTRLNLTGTNWDPDSATVMLKLGTIDQRTLSNSLDIRNPGSPISALSPKATSDVDTDAALLAHVKTLSNSAPSVFYAGRGWGSAVWDFYGAMLKALELHLNAVAHYPVHFCGYDWRTSNVSSGAILARQIASILQQENANKCVVVTHSMGGLVTRAALLAGATSQIEGVIHCVQPAHGAVVAYRRFQTGAIAPLDNSPLTIKAPLATVAAQVLNFILGNSPVAYAMTQAHLRGPVELLPSNEYPAIFLSATNPDLEANTKNAARQLAGGDVYTAYAQNAPPGLLPTPGQTDFVVITPPGVRVANPQVTFTTDDAQQLTIALNGARAFHQSLRSPNSWHPKTAMFYGDGIAPAEVSGTVANNTDVTFDWHKAASGDGTDPNFFRDLNITQRMATKTVRGDGTVPALSAFGRIAGASVVARQAFDVEHAGCFSNPIFQLTVENQVFQFSLPVFFPNLAKGP